MKAGDEMKQTFPIFIVLLSLLLLSSCNNRKDLTLNVPKETSVSIKKDIPATFIPQEMSIVAAGDSLTQGVGDSTGKGGYIPYLSNLLKQENGIGEVNIQNFGVRGNNSEQLLEKIQTSEVKEAISNADMVILTIGGNDIMKVVKENISDLQLEDFDNQMKEFETNLFDVLKSIKKENPDTSIVLVGVYNPFSKWFSNIQEMNQVVEEWNEIGENIIKLYEHTYFVSIADIFFTDQDDLLYKDYFHPNDKGYELIGEEIYKTINEAVSEILASKMAVQVN